MPPRLAVGLAVLATGLGALIFALLPILVGSTGGVFGILAGMFVSAMFSIILAPLGLLFSYIGYRIMAPVLEEMQWWTKLDESKTHFKSSSQDEIYPSPTVSGEVVSVDREKIQFCQYCGSPVEASDIFCKNCGSRIR